MDEDLSAANSLMVLQEEVIGSQQHPLSSQESTRRALLAKQRYSDAVENFPKRGRKKTGRRLYAPVKCLQCGFTTTEKDTRMCVRHALKHVNLERFYCPLCQFGAATHVEIIRHSETKHRLSFLIAADRVEHMIGNEKFCDYMVKCYGDEMGTRIVKNYAQHQEWGFRSKICQVCHQPLQGLRELHIARYHFPFAKPYSCPVENCEYDSRSESIFKDHFDKAHSDCPNLKPVFISERCPEAFQKMYDKCFPSEYRVLSPDERAQLIAENESYDAFLRGMFV